jgi:hypothetical protein
MGSDASIIIRITTPVCCPSIVAPHGDEPTEKGEENEWDRV